MQTLTELPAARTSARVVDLLLVESNPLEAESMLDELRQTGFEPRAEIVADPRELLTRMAIGHHEVIIADLDLPGSEGAEVIEVLNQLDQDTPLILVSENLDERGVRLCRQNCAGDFVERSCMARLPLAVERALALRSLRSELTQAECALRRSDHQQERVIELYSEAIVIVTQGQVAFLNSAACRLLGVPNPDTLAGRPFAALLHPDCRSSVDAQVQALTGTDDTASFAAWLLCQDARLVTADASATAIEFREQPSVQITFRDSGQHGRQADTSGYLAALAELNPNPVLQFSSTGEMTGFNQAACELALAVGFNHPRELLFEKSASIVKLCLAGGTKKAPFETKVGERTLSWSFYPLKQSGVVHCCITDVTDRLQLEAQLRHAQKMESVGRLAAGVAHDFNNVLTVIQGHTGLLRTNPSFPAECADSLLAITRAAERASKLTNQLLLFSRRSRGQPRALDLNEVLTNMSTMLQRTLGEDIQIQFDYAASLPPVLADVTLMEQVVMSLAVNARDAMLKGGTLLIGTSVALIDDVYVERHPEARPGSFVCLTLVDTGCGMDRVTLSRLFEPFFTTKEFGKGTGLGLATVYGIVKQHEGWIEVQSQVGQGTTFRIYLPPGQTLPDHRPDTGTHVGIPGGSETILVVEDEAPVRSIVRNILEKYGYKVLEAGAGVEALAIWHQHHEDIALLLTDMVMPAGLTGQELAEKFKHQKPGLEVIYISGYSVQPGDKAPDFVNGVNFLQKPFDADSLARAVRKRLDA